jgi:predicted TPR repeat methyltransferase
MQTGPLFVSSGDLIADRRYKWALDHAARGDFSGAADILAQTVELAPAFATAWFALGAIRERLGDREGAVAAFRSAGAHDPEDYHGARLQLARLGVGAATPAMTEAYVRRLFDQYAGRYDAALTGTLDYCGPAVLREAVEAAGRAIGRPKRFAAMLDLGCGTGLAGEAFRARVDRLAGVDVSPAMIAQAGAKALYDRLEAGDMLGFLAREDAQAHDLVVAADVFVYVHDLVPVFAAIARVLRPGGLVAFTVETHAGEGAKLLPTLRFAHGAEYVRAALAGAGLGVLRLSAASVRREKGNLVAGLVAVATASTASDSPDTSIA